MLYDSHTHLNNEDITEEELSELALEISDMNMLVNDIGFDWPSSVLAVEHANTYPWCYAVVGMHPHDSKLMDEKTYEGFKKLILDDRISLKDGTFRQNRIKAIGEIGLDFHYDLSPRDIQEYWFRRQIRLANELRMPIVIHSREADRLTMDILIEEGAFSDERKSWFSPKSGGEADPRVDIHCFSGSAEFSKEYSRLGATFGVDGPVTYKNNKKTVEFVEAVSMDSLLIETDAPYLTPVPFRGKRNKSPFVEYVAEKVAEIKGMTKEEVENITCENAKHFFDI